jgi:hypothetical protein
MTDLIDHDAATPLEYPRRGRPGPFGKYDEAVGVRHAKVAAIIAHGLERIRKEILEADPDTRNLDLAGDRAEIIRQAATLAAWQIRGFTAAQAEMREEGEL